MGAINTDTGLYEPPHAASGKKYTCPECGHGVKWTCPHMRQGKHVNAFFSHLPGHACEFYEHPSESLMHKEAKRQIAWLVNHGKILTFTSLCESCKTDDPIHTTTADNTALEEYSFDPTNRHLRADIGVINPDKTIALLIEILHTHSTEDRPEPWVEIRASHTIESISNGIFTFKCTRGDHQCAGCIEQEQKKLEEKKQLEEKRKLDEEKKRIEFEKEQQRKREQMEKDRLEEVERVKKQKEEDEARRSKAIEADKKRREEDAPKVAAYIASLSPEELQMHYLTAEMLKTRYDPRRTNGYLEWIKTVGSSH